MAMQGYFILRLFLLLLLSSVGIIKASDTPNYGTALLNRSSFPEGFIFGTASASYQYEGAAYEDGRGPSIWDTYTHKYPGYLISLQNQPYMMSSLLFFLKIKDGSNGSIEDVGIMKGMNLDAYRFSISWSRILPNGKLSGGVNKKGIDYYNNLINELLANGIQPFVTIFHWDLPQALEDEYGGFLSPHSVDDFRDYAELCFKEFGDRVKHWITLNEPWSYTMGGYVQGIFPTARCSAWQGLNCTGGDSGTEPYLVSHHLLLAHAAAVHVYKQKYQAYQKGKIGITLVAPWFVPFSNATHHQNAAKRALDFMFGWFMDPLTNGDYPHSMRSLVGSRLPKFSKEQAMMVKGSYDFLGLNYYTANYAAYAPTLLDWLYIYPSGIEKFCCTQRRSIMLHLFTLRRMVINLMNFGIDEVNNSTLSLKEALVDNLRIYYYYHHLSHLEEDGVNVKGYFAWSLLDNFEWNSGYTVRFGINFVDYKDGLKRYPKLSATWFKNFLKK
ncbi:hypothetical protein AAG906_032330 [Vitis piasezkii]